MGSQGEKRRQVLGTAAGGIVGAKVGADKGGRHNILGSLLGAFVGGVGGSFAADLVNAAVKAAEQASPGEATKKTDDLEQSLIRLGIYNFIRGQAHEAAQQGPLLYAMLDISTGFFQKHPEILANGLDKMSDDMAAEMTAYAKAAIRQRRAALLAEAEKQLKVEYEKYENLLKACGMDFKFDYSADKGLLLLGFGQLLDKF